MKSSFMTSMPLSKMIWQEKYALKDDQGQLVESSIRQSWKRVAKAAAKAEKKPSRALWQKRFYAAMKDYAFLPGGRILAGAGAKSRFGRKLTLFNCFVMNQIEDDTSSIFENLRQAALTMQRGGGIGIDFSTLRPVGALVRGVGADASGPVSFMQLWNAMCGTIRTSGARRGAMMASLRVDHPDIELFIDAKAQPGCLSNFNLSVLVGDDFMAAVERDEDWPLVFAGKIYRTLNARALFDRIMRASYDQAEPGILFMDHINRVNRLSYCETIYATNPCGEQPLPPFGACMLGSINLTRLVKHPFTPKSCLDEQRLRELVPVAVRFLDNIIDCSSYPLKEQKREARAKRRIGLGLTGLADALAMCGVRYGSPQSLVMAAHWMEIIQNSSYKASAALAREKGSFPLYDGEKHLASGEMQRLDKDVLARVKKHGLRNGLLTSIAPTGTISLLAGNVSGGIEPIFDLSYERVMRRKNGKERRVIVEDYACSLFRAQKGEGADLPDSFVTATRLQPEDHLAMQAALQPFVDSAISKTVNCDEQISFEAFRSIYKEAYRLGLKGCTTYRPNKITGSVLKSLDKNPDKSSDKSGEGAEKQADKEQAGLEQTSREQVNLEQGDIVYLSEPMQRDGALAGQTYKLRWPGSEHAIYVTINDVLVNERQRPFEIFINSKNLEHYAWTVALTRMISAVFRRGGDVSFVVEELKAVFDPRGGQWMGGHYVPSLLAAIGEVIEKHMLDTGFLVEDEESGGDDEPRRSGNMSDNEIKRSRENKDARYCPKCLQPAMVLREGCHSCASCGYSKCS